MTEKRSDKFWIGLLLALGIIRGIFLSDYRFTPNIILIPFVTPCVFALLAAYLFSSRKLSTTKATIWGALAVYLSTIVGVLVYGNTAGWDYVMNDPMSRIFFTATMGIQTIFYVFPIALLIRNRKKLRSFFDSHFK